MVKHFLLFALCLLPMVANASISVDGIYYNLTGGNQASVTSNPSKYSGSIIIPASFKYGNKTYSVTSIGSSAFSSCTSLTSVTIPESVTSIYAGAFSGCSGLTTITVADDNTTFDSRNNCNAIIETSTNKLIAGCQNTVIPNDVTSIGESAFKGCSGLTSITIPNGVTSIGISAFYDCSGMISITIPSSVTSINYHAFNGCSGLTSITIPNSVTIIENDAFNRCSGLTSITVADGNAKFDSRDNCNAIIETSTNKLLRGCQNTVIPNSVTDLGYYAFGGCSSLTSVTIPNSVTSIGDWAFSGCSNLTSVTVGWTTPLSISASTFSNRANATLNVPAGCEAAYEAADYWNEFMEIVEMPPVVSVGSTGFATFCSPVDVDFSDVTDIKAYIASGFNPSTGTLVLTRVTEVPAGEGLYIVGDEGSYNVPATTTDMVYSNLLKGVTTATMISPTDGDYTNFILANGSHGIGFYTLSSAGELAGGKAYLQLPTASVASVKAISFVFNDGDETGISNVKDVPSIEGIYNLQGQRISQPRKGLNIINGKKVVIK